MKYITYVDRIDRTEEMRVATGDSISELIRVFKPYIESDEYTVTTICSDGSYICWEDLRCILTREEKNKKRNEVKLKNGADCFCPLHHNSCK